MQGLNFVSFRKLMSLYVNAPENRPRGQRGQLAKIKAMSAAVEVPTAYGNMCIAYYIFCKNLIAHAGNDVAYSHQFMTLLKSETFTQIHERYSGFGLSS